ncbi:MAG: hypothetical protein M1365_09930 [Actinobacteria bacterium]|nr:hypothetical protein [Actinomycetota bacterium]
MKCCGNSDEQKTAASPLQAEQLENKPSTVKYIFVWGLIIALVVGFLASVH